MYFILMIKETKYVKRAHTFIHNASYWLRSQVQKTVKKQILYCSDVCTVLL